MRRLLIALLALAALDPFVPGLLHRWEVGRYESSRVGRFESSDLFALGPLVQYLREHPRGDRPRVVFFGNSIVWGYFGTVADSVPAQFQTLAPETRVFNMAINGFESGNAYLVTKDIVDSIDTVYLFAIGRSAHPMLAKLIPVDPADRARFGLTAPDSIESNLGWPLGFWHLYRDAYRLQAALFGTSTRLFVYQHKAALPSELWRAVRGQSAPDPEGPRPGTPAPAAQVEVRADVGSSPITDTRRRGLAAAHPLLWDYAELIRARGKHAVVIEIEGYLITMSAAERADLNQIFRPNVVFLTLAFSRSLTFDGMHLTPEGAHAVALALRRHAPPTAVAGRTGR